MSVDWTRKDLNEDLKRGHTAEKELDKSVEKYLSQKIMEYIEKERKKFQEKFPYCTKEYLAEKSGITYATYQNYLNGTRSIKLLTFLDIAQILHCNAGELLKSAIEEDRQN